MTQHGQHLTVLIGSNLNYLFNSESSALEHIINYANIFCAPSLASATTQYKRHTQHLENKQAWN